jgi:hypothetical protein
MHDGQPIICNDAGHQATNSMSNIPGTPTSPADFPCLFAEINLKPREQISNIQTSPGTMALPTTITPATLDTVLGHLAHHFLLGSSNDLPTARHAASHMLADYNVETEEELRLATEIVSFGFHALEALTEAAAPDLPPNRKQRLRGSAVSLSREAHKAQRKLDQLQRARPAASSQPQPQPQAEPSAPSLPGKPGTDQALSLIEFARETLQASAIKHQGGQAWTPSRQQRRAAERIANKLTRNAAEHARKQAMKAARMPAPTETNQPAAM